MKTIPNILIAFILVFASCEKFEEPENNTALLVKANALTMLADGILTATARNYYLSSAVELRARAQQ